MDQKDSILAQTPNSQVKSLGSMMPFAAPPPPSAYQPGLLIDDLPWDKIIFNEDKKSLQDVYSAFKKMFDQIQASFVRKSYAAAYDPVLKSAGNHLNNLADLAKSEFRAEDGASLSRSKLDETSGDSDKFHALFSDALGHANGLAFSIGTVASMLYDTARFCNIKEGFSMRRGIFESHRIKDQLQAAAIRSVVDYRDELVVHYASKPIEPKQPVVSEPEQPTPTEPDTDKVDQTMTDPPSVCDD